MLVLDVCGDVAAAHHLALQGISCNNMTVACLLRLCTGVMTDVAGIQLLQYFVCSPCWVVLSWLALKWHQGTAWHSLCLHLPPAHLSVPPSTTPRPVLITMDTIVHPKALCSSFCYWASRIAPTMPGHVTNGTFLQCYTYLDCNLSWGTTQHV